jgi:hypothetical protein
MDDDVIVRREERGMISVLTMEYRPYNLLGPTLIGAIAAEVTAAQEAGSRAIVCAAGCATSRPEPTPICLMRASRRAAGERRRSAASTS